MGGIDRAGTTRAGRGGATCLVGRGEGRGFRRFTGRTSAIAPWVLRAGLAARARVTGDLDFPRAAERDLPDRRGGSRRVREALDRRAADRAARPFFSDFNSFPLSRFRPCTSERRYTASWGSLHVSRLYQPSQPPPSFFCGSHESSHHVISISVSVC